MNEQFNQILDYLEGMWDYRWSALAIAWLVAIGGWVYVYLLPDQYQARSVVYVDRDSILKPLLGGLAVDTDNSSETIVMKQILLSRDNLEEVLRSTDMDLTAHSPIEKDRLLTGLRSSISITGGEAWQKGPGRDIYEIKATGMSPRTLYQIVSKLLDAFVENTLKSTRTDTEQAQTFLDEQIKLHEERLTRAEQRLAAFKEAKRGYMPDEKGTYYARVQARQDQIEAMRTNLKLAIQRREVIRRQIKGESPVIGGQYGDANSPAARLRQYQSQLADLLTRYTEQHPQVMSLKYKIELLQSGGGLESADMGSESTETGGKTTEFNPVYQQMKLDLAKADIEIANLRTQITDQERKVSKLQEHMAQIPEVEAELTRLNRDYAVTKIRYETLVERRESARLAQQADQSSDEVKFRIIEAPVVPARPTGPNRLLLLTGVFVAAVGAGVGWALLRLMLNPTYLNTKQLSSATGLPVLGAVTLRRPVGATARLLLGFASFMVVCVVLLGVYLGVVIEKDNGSKALREAVAQLEPRLKAVADQIRIKIDI